MRRSMTEPVTILVTRPTEMADEFAQACRKRLGDQARLVVSPVVGIEFFPLDTDLPSDATLVFTSRNGVRAWARWNAAPPAATFVVGSATANEARKAGLHPISADGNAGDLIRLLQSQPRGLSFVHVRGAHSAGDLAGTLRKGGASATEIVGYDQITLHLSQEARTALSGQERVILPVFSPRSATVLREQIPQNHAPLVVVAISKAASVPLSDLGCSITVAARPNQPSILDALDRNIAPPGRL